jgi:amino acid transporter
MMNRWAFLIVLLVILLVLTAFILVSTLDFGTTDQEKTFNGRPLVFNVAYGLLIAAFVLPIFAFIMYLLTNGMFSFAMCR